MSRHRILVAALVPALVLAGCTAAAAPIPTPVLRITPGPSSGGGLGAHKRVSPSPTAAPRSTPAPTPTQIPGPELRPVARVDLGRPLGLVMVHDDAVYVQAGGIVRVDPKTLRAKVAVDGLSGQWAMNVGFGSAWLSRSVDDHGWMERYDLETGELEAKIDVGKAPVETLSALGHVWVPDHHGGTVYRIDPRTNTVDGSIAVDLDPIELAAGGGRIWVVGPHARRLAAIDAKTLEVTLEASFPELVCGVAYLGGRVWVRSCTGPKVYVLDASTGAEVADLDSLTPVKDGDRAWSPFPEDDDRFLVGRLDPESVEVSDRVRIVGLPLSHAVGHGSLWTTSGTTLYGWALDDLP